MTALAVVSVARLARVAAHLWKGPLHDKRTAEANRKNLMYTIQRSFLVAVGLGILALSGTIGSRSAQAQTAVSYSQAGKFDTETTQFSLGFSFTPTQNLLLTALGYLNDGATGPNATHQVQIYQITSGGVLAPASGTALLGTPVSVTTSGASAAFNTFAYVPVSGLTLLANTPYEIVADNNGNGFAYNAVSPVFNGITYGTSTYALNATTPVFNSNVFSANDPGNFGPNFQFVPSAPVPEASSLTLFAAGGLVLLSLCLRGRKLCPLFATRR